MIVHLPKGRAREAYLHYRARGHSQGASLAAAAKIEDVEAIYCSRCDYKLSPKEAHAPINTMEVICINCLDGNVRK